MIFIAQSRSVSANEEFPGYDQDAPDAVSSYQKFTFSDPDRTTFEFIRVYSDSPEAAIAGYEQTLREHNPNANPYENFEFGGLFQSPEALQKSARAVNSKTKIPAANQVFLQWKSPGKRFQASSADLKRTNRKPAGFEDGAPLTRRQLLEHWTKLKSNNPSIEWNKVQTFVNGSEKVEKTFAGHGAELIDLAFKGSKNRIAFIIIRGSLGGVGAYIGATMSDMDPEVTAFMTALGAALSTTIQMQIGRLGNFLTKTGKGELAMFNVILRPLTLFRKQVSSAIVGTKSSWFAFMAKWYLTEYTVNQLNRVGGYFAYEKLFPDAKVFTNGVAEVPKAFQPKQGFHDALELGFDTLLTQGTYEQVFMTEFERRTLPYHELMGYYSSLLETTVDETLRKEYQHIIDSCLKLGMKERVTRAGLATLGSASWIMALAFKGHSEAISKLCSYSLLPVAGGLKTYYYFREKAENAFLTGLDTEASQKLKKSMTETITDFCRSKTKTVQEWAKEFTGYIVNVKPMKGAAP